MDKENLKQLIRNILSKELGLLEENIKIEEIVTSKGSEVGDGFTCLMTAIHVKSKVLKGDTFQSNDFNFLVKSSPDNPEGTNETFQVIQVSSTLECATWYSL